MGVSEEGEERLTCRGPCSSRSRPRGFIREEEEEEVFFSALFLGLGVPGRSVILSLKHNVSDQFNHSLKCDSLIGFFQKLEENSSSARTKK